MWRYFFVDLLCTNINLIIYIMKKTIISILILTFLFSCGGIKTPTGEEDVYIPCQGDDFKSNKKYFRAFGSSISNNPNGAIQDAESMAAAQLALDVQSVVKVVSERYSENIVEGMKGEFTSISNQLSRQVAKMNKEKSKIICTKTTRDKSSGMYKHYLTIELSVDDFVDDYVSQINSKSKNSIRVNQQNFRKVFDEEMD